MNILCSKDILNENINIVAKAVSNRSTLPVLEGIYLKAEESGKLILKGNDMELSIEAEMSADVKAAGEAVINAKIFGNIIKTLSCESVSIEINERNNILIRGGKAKFEIPLISASEFPEIVKPQLQYSVKIDKGTLKDMINKTIFSVSLTDTRPVLTGCLLEIDKNILKMVALDGYRMAVRKAVIEEELENNKIIIPAKALNELTKIIKDDGDEFIKISCTSNHALFEFDNCRMYTRLIEGEYINYESIITPDFEKEIECPVDELYSAISRASLLLSGEAGKSVKMRVERDNINISCESQSGSVDDNISVDNPDFELTIGFNHRYLSDALKACDCERVKLKLKASRTPLIIEPIEEDNFLYLILPVRLNEE